MSGMARLLYKESINLHLLYLNIYVCTCDYSNATRRNNFTCIKWMNEWIKWMSVSICFSVFVRNFTYSRWSMWTVTTVNECQLLCEIFCCSLTVYVPFSVCWGLVKYTSKLGSVHTVIFLLFYTNFKLGTQKLLVFIWLLFILFRLLQYFDVKTKKSRLISIINNNQI